MRAVLISALALLLAGCVEPSHATHDEADPPQAGPTDTPSNATSSPYSGQESRTIKALSAEEIAGYETGGGLGYAKPAELNSYPGPLHALEMADHLDLTPEQREALTTLRAEVVAEAVPLGKRYLQVETAIERSFREGEMDAGQLGALLNESGSIEVQLRFVHLGAHLATKGLLTTHQIALYDEARGYSAADHTSHEHT